MFININRNKRPVRPKYFLSKPNKIVITNMTNYIRENNCLFKLGNINELNFTVPYFIEGDGELIYNKDIDFIKEKMYIKMQLGYIEEWFIIDGIEDKGDTDETMSVTAFSIGYELSHKKISTYEIENTNIETAINDIILDTNWTLKWVDPPIVNLYRTLSVTDSNGLDTLLEIAQTFDATIEWNTVDRQISVYQNRTLEEELKETDSNGVYNKYRYRGLTVNYGKLLKSLNRSRTTDEMTTRLYVYGNEGLSINTVNPLGQSYIEDFSFFLYPFERDENKNVLKHSDFMTDELCNAILDYNDLVDTYSPTYKSLVEQLKTLNEQYGTASTELIELQNQYDTILDLIDLAKATEDYDLVAIRTAERDVKAVEVSSKQSEVDKINSDIVNVEAQMDALMVSLGKDANFTLELRKELRLYIIEKEFNDDRYIDEQELFDDAKKKFKELREPAVSITIDIENFLEIIEEQYNWDKLILGDYIKIKYPQMKMEYMAKIIEINYDFSSYSISLTIANTESASEIEKLNKIIYESKTATSLINNSKYKWDKVDEYNNEVWELLNSTWDANKRTITAGVNNDIEIGKRGIIIRDPKNPMNVVIIQSGIIALSNDGGVTWKTGITAEGIIAERLMGVAFIGQRLTIQDNEGTQIIKGSKHSIYDRLGNLQVLLGEYRDNEFGLYIPDGAVEIHTNEEPNRGVILDGQGLRGYNGSGMNTFELNTDGFLKLWGGAIDIRTDFDSNQGVILDGYGLHGYNPNREMTFDLNTEGFLKLWGGYIDIRTSFDSYQGIVLDGDGFRAYDEENELTVNIESDTGNVTIKGDLTGSNGIFNGSILSNSLDENGDVISFTFIDGGEFLSHGYYLKNWGDTVQDEENDMDIRIQNGLLRFRNNTKDWSLYMSDYGISTYANGTASLASGTLLFRDVTYYNPDNPTEGKKGVTLHSTAGIVTLVSEKSSIYINPMKTSREGNNLFKFYVKNGDTASDTDGVLMYGSHVDSSPFASGIRFSKARSEPTIWITDNTGAKKTGNLVAKKISGEQLESKEIISTDGGKLKLSVDANNYIEISSSGIKLVGTRIDFN